MLDLFHLTTLLQGVPCERRGFGGDLPSVMQLVSGRAGMETGFPDSKPSQSSPRSAKQPLLRNPGERWEPAPTEHLLRAEFSDYDVAILLLWRRSSQHYFVTFPPPPLKTTRLPLACRIQHRPHLACRTQPAPRPLFSFIFPTPLLIRAICA